MDDWDTGPTNTDFESIPRHDQAIIDAAVNGDVAAVRQWLDDGGNADARIKTLPSPGLPDPIAHLVCKFWLGEPPKKTG